MRVIPFYKPSLGPEEIEEVVATLKSGWLTTGPRVKQFEEAFARDILEMFLPRIFLLTCVAAPVFQPALGRQESLDWRIDSFRSRW